jgi:hypothetical protein
MRDGVTIKGKEIEYRNKIWTITEFYYVPKMPKIYVELYDGNVRMNVELDDIKSLIVE